MNILKKPVFVSISPNSQGDDMRAALKLLFSPWKWIEGGAVGQFTEAFKKYLGMKSVFIFNSGRTSLYAILRSIDLKSSDEVLVQGFTCAAAVDPILWVGAKPVYVDIETGTYNMSPSDLQKKITRNSKVLVIQHTFGFPAKLDELVRIAKEHNLVVVEDVAHSLGAEYKNRKLGTFGTRPSSASAGRR